MAIKLHVKKCDILHVGPNNPLHLYVLQKTKLRVVTSMTDLGVVVNNSLRFDTYVDKIVAKAYRRCYSILNGFICSLLIF